MWGGAWALVAFLAACAQRLVRGRGRVCATACAPGGRCATACAWHGACAQRCVCAQGLVCRRGGGRNGLCLGGVRNGLKACGGGGGGGALSRSGGVCATACAGGCAGGCVRTGQRGVRNGLCADRVCATRCARAGGACAWQVACAQGLVRRGGGSATACAWQGACAAKEVTHEL